MQPESIVARKLYQRTCPRCSDTGDYAAWHSGKEHDKACINGSHIHFGCKNCNHEWVMDDDSPGLVPTALGVNQKRRLLSQMTGAFS